MPQIERSDHFVAKSLWHLESKVDDIMVKDGNSLQFGFDWFCTEIPGEI